MTFGVLLSKASGHDHMCAGSPNLCNIGLLIPGQLSMFPIWISPWQHHQPIWHQDPLL